MASILCQINDSWLELFFYNNYIVIFEMRFFFFIYSDSTPHSVPSISPQKSHAVTRMHLLLLFHNFSYLLFSMLLQALGWFWCKKYRVSINETGGGRRIVLWANRICKTCRNCYLYNLLSLFSTFSFLKVSFEKTINFSWFFPILKP